MMNVKCPYCGKSYYQENYSTRTAMYYPIVWKDGVVVSQDGNISTYHCTCLNCGQPFKYQERYGEIWNGYDS